jgi:hypothetical protein
VVAGPSVFVPDPIYLCMDGNCLFGGILLVAVHVPCGKEESKVAHYPAAGNLDIPWTEV